MPQAPATAGFRLTSDWTIRLPGWEGIVLRLVSYRLPDGKLIRVLTDRFDLCALSVAQLYKEFERDLIRERTRAGRKAAKRRGVRFGRPKKINADQKDLAARLRAEGKSAKEVAKTFGVHVSTIYRLYEAEPP